tara:strand:- start:579 stop:989 length:411 start_codon:yes stop_codon:yes gene_type:complete
MEKKWKGAQREIFDVGCGPASIRLRKLNLALRPGSARLQLIPDSSGRTEINQKRAKPEGLTLDGSAVLEPGSGEAPPGVEASVLPPELFKSGAKRCSQQRGSSPGGAAPLEHRSEEEEKQKNLRAPAGRGVVGFFK